MISAETSRVKQLYRDIYIAWIPWELGTPQEEHTRKHAYFMECHDDVIKWKHFPRYWPFVRRIHRSPVNSPHKGLWRGVFKFSLICARIYSWVNNGEAGDLRRHHGHYDVILMFCICFIIINHCIHDFQDYTDDIEAILRLPQCQQSNPGENGNEWINPLSTVNHYCSTKPYISNVYLLFTMRSIKSWFKDYRSRQPLWIAQSLIVDSVFEFISMWRSSEIND